MKHSWRDYCTILMAFAAVFLCGYGIGHLVGERRTQPAKVSPSADSWEGQTLQALTDSLELRPEQTLQVEQELSSTADAIRKSRDAVLLDYHQHIDQLYGRLIDLLDPKQAARLLIEKKSLEKHIKDYSTNGPAP